MRWPGLCMRTVGQIVVTVFGVLVVLGGILADDAKKPAAKEPKPGPLTLLGTVKGDVSKVTEGGYKIDLKFREVVASLTESNPGQGASGYARFRLPGVSTKDKSQKLELRLLPQSTVRLLKPSEEKKGEGEKDVKEASEKELKDDADMKKKEGSKETKKPAPKAKEKPLPGKPGTPRDLVKGQVVIVTVAREDLPGYSRLIATSVYVLGEK